MPQTRRGRSTRPRSSPGARRRLAAGGSLSRVLEGVRERRLELHVDVPFHHDHEIGVMNTPFGEILYALVEEFAAELDSARFDVRRLRLAA